MLLRSSRVQICDQSGIRQAECIGFFKSIFTRSVGINEVVRICIKKFDRTRFFLKHILAKKGKSAVMSRVVAKKLADYDKRNKQKKKKIVIEKEQLLYFAIVLSTKKRWGRRDGVFVRTRRNRAVFMDNSYKLRGSRIKGPVSKEMRTKRRSTTFFRSLYSNAPRRI